MFLKILTMEYNCKPKCFMWLGGYDGYIYLLQLLTFFSYELCCLPFLVRTLEVSHRNVGGILLLLLKEMSHIIAENFKNQTLHLKLNEVKMILRNLTF